MLHTRGEDKQGREGFLQFFHNSSLFSVVCVIFLAKKLVQCYFTCLVSTYLYPVFVVFVPSALWSIFDWDSECLFCMLQIPLDTIFLGFDTLTNLKITVPLVRLTQFILCLWCPKSTASLSFLVLKNVLKIHPFWTEGISVSQSSVVSRGPLFYLSFLV